MADNNLSDDARELTRSVPFLLAALAFDRFQRQRGATGQLQRRRFDNLRRQAADAHLEPGQLQNRHQLRHVLQIELVARMVLGDQQQVLRLAADARDG